MGKKNKLGGSNNKEICFSSVRAPPPGFVSLSLSSYLPTSQPALSLSLPLSSRVKRTRHTMCFNREIVLTKEIQSVRILYIYSAGFEGRASNKRLLLIDAVYHRFGQRRVVNSRHETTPRHVDGNGHETVKNFKRTKLGTKRGKNQRAVLTRARAIAIFIVGRSQFSACQFTEITRRQILFPFVSRNRVAKEKRNK